MKQSHFDFRQFLIEKLDDSSVFLKYSLLRLYLRTYGIFQSDFFSAVLCSDLQNKVAHDTCIKLPQG